MQADYDARNLPNIIPKAVIAAHSADGCFTDSRPQGQLLLRSAAVMNQLHKGGRRAARKGFEILRIFLIQCFFTQILIQIQGANQRIGTISTFASLLIAFPPSLFPPFCKLRQANCCSYDASAIGTFICTISIVVLTALCLTGISYTILIGFASICESLFSFREFC